MYKEQTNILLYILEDRRLIDQRYIGANFYTSHSHPAREKGIAIVGCGFSKSRRKFSNIFQQSIKIAVHHNLGEISPTPTFGGGGGWPRLGLPPDVRIFPAKFHCICSYRVQMHEEQTDKQTFFFIYGSAQLEGYPRVHLFIYALEKSDFFTSYTTYIMLSSMTICNLYITRNENY